jgi:glucose 1-dehydrogenase
LTQCLAGRRALVTGAARGIGRGIAIELARAGATVTINDLQDGPEAQEVADECRRVGGDGLVIAGDVSNRGTMEALIQESIAKMGGLDIAVSNAAYSDRRLMIDQPYEEFQRTINVSMMGAYHLVRYAAQAMVAQNSQSGANVVANQSNIVVISSPHAHMPIPGALAYNMAKAASDQLAKTAACELSGHGIRVNLVHPGWIDTPGERKFFSEETLQAEGRKIPMGRLGQPNDLGRGVVFLCDPANNYITGSTLTIDGGIQLPWREMFRIEEARSQGSA